MTAETPSIVLWIDADRERAAALSRPLIAAGHEVELAIDGSEGLVLTRSLRPAVVLCDWKTPGVPGLDYCRTIKSDPDYRNTYVAMVVDPADPEQFTQSIDAGADDVLHRPVAPAELLSRVRAGMRIRALQRQVVEAGRREVAMEMAVTLGHEINNPLTALLGHLELMEQYMQREDPTRTRHHIAGATDSASRIAEVARSLIELRDPKMKPYLGDQQMLDLELSKVRQPGG